MKINFKLAFVILCLSFCLFLQSCKDPDPIVKGSYQSGVLIVNEGSFSSNNGDVTFYNTGSDLLEQNIFKKENGSFAGKALQSMSVDGDDGYLVLSGGNKIEVVKN
jgi:hypothetical protein